MLMFDVFFFSIFQVSFPHPLKPRDYRYLAFFVPLIGISMLEQNKSIETTK